MNKLHPLKVIAFSLIGSALIYTAMEFRHERISNYSSGVALEKISSKEYDFAVISAYVDGCHLPKLLYETFDTGYNVYEEEQIEDDGTVVFFVYTVLNYSFHPVYDANISSPGELGNILCNPNPQGRKLITPVAKGLNVEVSIRSFANITDERACYLDVN